MVARPPLGTRPSGGQTFFSLQAAEYGAAIVRELKLLLPQLERLEGPPSRCHQAQLTLDRFVL